MKIYSVKLKRVFKGIIGDGTTHSFKFGLGEKEQAIAETWTLIHRKYTCSRGCHIIQARKKSGFYPLRYKHYRLILSHF